MAEEIEKFIHFSKVDFIDIRYETKTETQMQYSSKELKEVGSNITDGYAVRILHRGGMAGMAVTDFKDIKEAIGLLMGAARLASSKNKKPVKLAPAPATKANVKPKLANDPRKVPMEEKLDILKTYNGLILDQPDIKGTELKYFEVNRQKHYMNSEGTDISEELMTVGIAGEISAKRGTQVRNVRVSIGGATGMASLLNRNDVFVKKVKIARKLLDAKSIKGGKYDVILNPAMTGVFAHEAFGHLSEADGIEDKAQFRKRMRVGAKLGSENITIIADSTMPGNLGFYRYDDEGVAVRPITLIEKGVLKGRLHSRKTAASFNESITGHCIAEDHGHLPIIRMGNIYVKPGKFKFSELLEAAKDGLYLCDAKGGQTNGENFTFGTQYGYRVRNGELGEMILDTNLMGNLFTTLKKIRAADNELVFCERGGCGKGVQYNIKSAHGGPNMLITGAVVGGE